MFTPADVDANVEFIWMIERILTYWQNGSGLRLNAKFDVQIRTNANANVTKN